MARSAHTLLANLFPGTTKPNTQTQNLDAGSFLRSGSAASLISGTHLV